MIHYGKTPHGDFELIVPADNVGEFHNLLYSSGLIPRRALDGLQDYIEKEFADELALFRRRMTAQIPVKEGGDGHAAV